MKKSIFLYLFLFSFIINVFLVVNDGRILKEKDHQIEKYQGLNDSLTVYKNKYKEASYFSIDENKKAQDFYKEYGYQEVMGKVLNDFTVLNQQPDGNPLLPKSMDGSKSVVYKATVLNHKWMIVAYKNASKDGELLVEYLFNPNEFTTFNVISELTYKQ